jgi:hypothetical protein
LCVVADGAQLAGIDLSHFHGINRAGHDHAWLRKRNSLKDVSLIPLIRTSRAAGDASRRCGNRFLRQPSHPQGVRRWVPGGFAATLPQCSGDSSVSLTPCMRCDVRIAELQEGRTVGERGG